MNNPTRYAHMYQALFGRNPPDKMTWETSTADILNPGRGFMHAFDYTLQLQVGCPGGCLFCYVPTGARLTPRQVRGSDGGNWGYLVRNKVDVIEKFQKHLRHGRLADKTLYWSGVTDPYATPPAVTRDLWTVLLQTPSALKPRRIVVQTRFRPDRDVDLMAEYQETTTVDSGPPLLISYSIGTDNNHLIAAWEKSTPLFEQRMKAIHTLRQAGLFVVATLSPLGLWNDMSGTLTQLHTWGIAYLTTLFLKNGTQSANTPSQFLKYVQAHHPILLNPVWHTEQLQAMQAIYGESLVLVGQKGFHSLAKPHLVVAEKQYT